MNQYRGLLLLAVPLVLLWILFARTRRQQRRVSDVQTAVQEGDRVMTTSGLFGTVVAADDLKVVELEVAPGVRTIWARQAILRVVDDDQASPDVVDVRTDDRTDDRTDGRAGSSGPANG